MLGTFETYNLEVCLHQYIVLSGSNYLLPVNKSLMKFFKVINVDLFSGIR